jgi:hypothetical protein
MSTPGGVKHPLSNHDMAKLVRAAGWRGEGAVAREAPHLTHHDGQGTGDASRYTSRLEASRYLNGG